MSDRKFILRLVILTGALFAAGLPLRATEPAKPDAAQLEKAKAAYPLTTCVVSDDKLGEMGDPVDYVYQQAGQPDRLVRFCCKNCVKDFTKDPAQYLKKIDDAAATAKASATAKK